MRGGLQRQRIPERRDRSASCRLTSTPPTTSYSALPANKTSMRYPSRICKKEPPNSKRRSAVCACEYLRPTLSWILLRRLMSARSFPSDMPLLVYHASEDEIVAFVVSGNGVRIVRELGLGSGSGEAIPAIEGAHEPLSCGSRVRRAKHDVARAVYESGTRFSLHRVSGAC